MVRKLAGILSVVVLCSLPAISHADTITFTANSGSGNSALGASAMITTGDGVLTIVLSNTLSASSIRSTGEDVSDISITLGNSAGTQGTATASGQLGLLDGSNKVTYAGGAGSNDPSRWTTGTHLNVSGETVSLDVLGGGTPTELILPTLANGGTYSNGNGGFANFNAYVIGPATFVIDLSGVTADTTVTGVTFSFGTEAGTDRTGVPTSPVPEPSSLALLGTGILGAAGAMRRRFVGGLKRG